MERERQEQEQPQPVTIEEEAMRQEKHVELKVGELLPSFKLENINGEIVSPWDYKEKQNLLLFFFDVKDSQNWEDLAVIKGRYQELKELTTEVLAVAQGSKDEIRDCVGSLDLPFQVLIDDQRKVIDKLGIPDTSVLVTDRFNELRLTKAAGDDIEGVLSAAIHTIELVESECPECGVTTWEQP